MDLLRRIPKIDKLLNEATCQRLLTVHPRQVVLAAVRQVLEALRSAARLGTLQAGELESAAVSASIERCLADSEAFSLRRVVNGTGVVLHTNLGRSSLAPRLR